MKNTFLYFFMGILLIFTGCSGDRDKFFIRVMSLNVRYDEPRDSINAWPNRASVVCDFIKNESPDILGLQEVLVHQYNFLDSVLTDYGSVGIGRDDGARSGEMNPVFFKKEKFDQVRTITFWLSETPDIPGSVAWGSSLPRIVTWLELVDRETHQHFFFFNTHFAHDSDSARVMSSQLLLNKVDTVASGFPFIITGDFNMLPDSRGYKILTGPFESIPLLIDSYNVCEKRPGGPSYTFNGFSDKRGEGRIDYIFVKDGMKVSDHKTTIEKSHGIFISDHWPVDALVSLKIEDRK